MSRLLADAIGRFLTPIKRISSQIEQSNLILADTINNMSLSASQQNNISIAFSGAAIFDEILIPFASHTVSGTDRVVIAFKSIIRRTSDNNITIVEGTMVAGDSNIELYNDGTNEVYLVASTPSGYFWVQQQVGTAELQCTILFYTQPGTKTGIVGPAGVDGEIIKSEWGTSITWEAGYETSTLYPLRYRLFDDCVQLNGRGEVSSGTLNTSANVQIARLPTGYRPGADILLPIQSDLNVIRMRITSTGQMIVQTTHGQSVDSFIFDGVIFPTIPS